MEIISFKGGFDRNFSYLLIDNQDCCLLDSCLPAKEILDYVNKNNLNLNFIILLHSHFDHIVDIDIYNKLRIPLYAHELTNIEVDRLLKDKETISVGSIKIKVLHTPGHRFDCICLLVKKCLFTSDTLFIGGCGRIDLPGSNPEEMWQTLYKLTQLPDDLVIYSGHDYGDKETDTLGNQKKHNKYLVRCLKEVKRI